MELILRSDAAHSTKILFDFFLKKKIHFWFVGSFQWRSPLPSHERQTEGT